MPAASVTASREAAVSLCVIVTVAPGTAAPLSSVTLPTSEPYNTWASTDDARHDASSARPATTTLGKDKRHDGTGNRWTRKIVMAHVSQTNLDAPEILRTNVMEL